MQNTLIPDARQLLESAYGLLYSLDSTSAAYQNLYYAISSLESIIQSSNPGTSDIANGMAVLTQAMVSAY